MIKKLQLSHIPGLTYQTCVRYNKPVVITGVNLIFPNLANWNMDYAAEKIIPKETLVLQKSHEKNRTVGNMYESEQMITSIN